MSSLRGETSAAAVAYAIYDILQAFDCKGVMLQGNLGKFFEETFQLCKTALLFLSRRHPFAQEFSADVAGLLLNAARHINAALDWFVLFKHQERATYFGAHLFCTRFVKIAKSETCSSPSLPLPPSTPPPPPLKKKYGYLQQNVWKRAFHKFPKHPASCHRGNT